MLDVKPFELNAKGGRIEIGFQANVYKYKEWKNTHKKNNLNLSFLFDLVVFCFGSLPKP